MGTFLMSSSSFAPKRLAYVYHKHVDRLYLLKRNKNEVNCQLGSENESSGFSCVLKKKSALSALKSKAHGTTTTTLMDMHDDGIGIIKFLTRKDLIITGATGFLAKVLLEKILRTTPDVGKIYLLIKAKNKEVAMQRLKDEIISIELFKSLQQRYGKSYQDFMLSKLIPVVGNVCESNLGLDEDLVDEIAKKVDVIVNSAANTTFDERYDVAIDTNTIGPSRLMSFAKTCKKLKLFLHVSTAYVNGQREGRIMEKPFIIGDNIANEILTSETSSVSGLPILNIENEIKLAFDLKEEAFEGTLDQKMKQLGLKRAKKYGWQNTYEFTKAMGEMIINNMKGDIPVVIIRPSIIESTFKEPFPGWIEGNRMLDPIITYYGKGQLTGILANPNTVIDVVPADMVVNATLAAMARHGTLEKPDINVYHIASSVVKPIVFQEMTTLFYQHYNSLPRKDSKGRPIHVPPMEFFNSMDDLSDHLWKNATLRSGLAAAMDSHNQTLSKKLEIICRKLVEHLKYLANIYEPYSLYGGRFDNSNTQRLMEFMSEEEKREFGFDVTIIDWKDYITNVHIPGLRRHVIKERKMPSKL